MTGRIIISRDCSYFWRIECATFIVEGRCNFTTPERAVQSARKYGDILMISLDDDIEQRCL